MEEGDSLSERVIGCAMEVHRRLGPGLLESAYEACLAHELSLHAVAFETQVALPIAYREIRLDCGYRLDFLIEKRLIVEIKSVSELSPVHQAQLITYLKLAKMRVGLLINFNVTLLRHGLKRVVL